MGDKVDGDVCQDRRLEKKGEAAAPPASAPLNRGSRHRTETVAATGGG